MCVCVLARSKKNYDLLEKILKYKVNQVSLNIIIKNKTMFIFNEFSLTGKQITLLKKSGVFTKHKV